MRFRSPALPTIQSDLHGMALWDAGRIWSIRIDHWLPLPHVRTVTHATIRNQSNIGIPDLGHFDGRHLTWSWHQPSALPSDNQTSWPNANLAFPFWLKHHQTSEGIPDASPFVATITLTSKPKDEPAGDDPEPEEPGYMLSGMLAAAAQDCRMRAAAIRAGLKGRFKGQQLKEALAAARQMAADDLRGTLGGIRLRHSRRNNRRLKRRRPTQVRPNGTIIF
jgi:hypothetical protein